MTKVRGALSRMQSEIARPQEIATSFWAIRIIIPVGVFPFKNHDFRVPRRLLRSQVALASEAGASMDALAVTTLTPTSKLS